VVSSWTSSCARQRAAAAGTTREPRTDAPRNAPLSSPQADELALDLAVDVGAIKRRSDAYNAASAAAAATQLSADDFEVRCGCVSHKLGRLVLRRLVLPQDVPPTTRVDLAYASVQED
jgi:hypothetical protein